MILCIADVLSAADLAALSRGLGKAVFQDGRKTAGWHARKVKRNEQAAPASRAAREAGERITTALKANPVFNAGVQPRAIRPFLLSRYGAGMEYGPHVDDAIMGSEQRMRSDVSVTVFLNPPEAYDGGELVIETAGGEQSFKLPAGHAIAYPSTSLHRVEKVTRGTRLVAVTWVQSLVRAAEDREILFDLDMARHAIFEQHGKTREFDLIAKSYANLLRKWSDV
jgi:PKHD-type hydroxylase